MSITAVENYVATLINGAIGAYNNTPLQAWTEPPTGQATAETPQAFVTAAEYHGQRQTMGGVQGYYVEKHQIYVLVQWAINPQQDQVTRNLAFKNMIDTIINIIRTSYTGVIQITDPATGNNSQLLAIGEQIRGRILPPQSTDSPETLLFSAQLTLEAEEKVQYVANPQVPGSLVAM